MPSLNKVFLIGNLTRDPELRYTPSGTAVCDLGLAINEKFKDKETTVFVDVTLWGRTAEVADEYLSKGSPVLIEGRLRFDQWEKDGQKRSKLAVTGERMQMLGRKGDTPSQGGEPVPDGAPADKSDDDIPF